MPGKPKQKKQAMKEDPNVFWMIRRKSDGLFSRGGVTVRWSKNGKMWLSQAKVLAHLKAVARVMTRRYRGVPVPPPPYQDAEVVQFRMVEEVKMDVTGYGE